MIFPTRRYPSPSNAYFACKTQNNGTETRLSNRKNSRLRRRAESIAAGSAIRLKRLDILSFTQGMRTAIPAV